MEKNTILNERYEIKSQIGKGGMAFVYKAFDKLINRTVAIKIIRTDRKLTPSALKRFDREAKFLAKLDHPNIVKLYDYGENEGIPYLVMEYVDGETLKHKMGKTFTMIEAAKWLAPIAKGLAYAHDHGVIHRDIKPSNILIGTDGTPKISDFGIAKLAESEMTMDLTGNNVSVGTPEYMSPEQGLGKTIDGRTDIYSLGIVLYEMVTAKKPFTSDTPLGMLHQHVTEPVIKPSQVEKQFSNTLDSIILTALEKEPTNRYRSMNDFAEVLEGIITGKKLQKINRSKGNKKNKLLWLLIIPIVIILAFIFFGNPKSGVFDLNSTPTDVTTKTETTTDAVTLQEQPSSSTNAINETAIPTIESAPQFVLGGETIAFSFEPITLSNISELEVTKEKQLTTITDIHLSPNNQYLLVSYAASLSILDSITLEEITTVSIGERIVTFEIAPDGNRVALLSNDGKIIFWDPTLDSLSYPSINIPDPVSSLAYSGDGTKMAVGTKSGTIYILNTKNQSNLLTITDQKQTISVIRFSNDGTIIATGSEDHSVRLYDVSNGDSIKNYWDYSNTITAIEFSNKDGFLIASPNNNQLNLYDLGSNTLIRSYTGHSAVVSALGFSSQDDLIFSASQDGAFRAWPVDGQYVSKIFKNHLSGVIRILVSSDGRMIYTTSKNGQILQYHIP